jgi:ATP-binding cassette subfamily B protein
MADNATPAAESASTVSPHRVVRIAKNVRLTVALAWAAAPRHMVGVLLATLVGAVITPLTILFTGCLVDAVAARPASWREPIILVPIVVLAALASASKSIGTFAERLQDLFSDRVWMYAHKRFLSHVASVDLALLDDPSWHDKLQRARADVGWRPYNLTLTLIHIFSSSVTLLSLFSALFYLDPRLLLLAVLSVLPPALMRLRVNQRFYDLFWKTTRREREHDYMVQIASQPQFAKDVRAFGLGEHVVGRAKAASEDRLAHKRRLYRSATLGDLVGSLGASAVLVGAYFVIADSATKGTLSVGDVAAIFGAFTSLTAHLGATLQAFVTVDQHAQFLDDYFRFLSIEPAIRRPAHPKPVPSPLSRVALEGVSFHYPSHADPTLTDVSIEVKAGQLVALVGENGAGKSTLVKLLLRFFDPVAGTVRFGDVDARDLDPAELRARVGVLFQDYGAYELEVKDVVGFGRVDEPFDEERARAALKAARADGIVDEIGHGLDSIVGRLFEGGHDLSGGQWQRLALARLIYRDAELWILDEPTANLDPSAEAEIFEELRGLLKGRMGIVISHRFSTVRSADEIVVLEHGRVIERGTHDALMAKDGRYAEMFRTQATGYR